MNFVGIDVGRKYLKIATEEDTQIIPSKVGDARELRLENTSDYLVAIDGHKYFVGDLAEESYSCREMATESKIHQETKILFLTAVALAWDRNPLVITTGLPVDQHTQTIKQQLKQLLDGVYKVMINNCQKNIYINRLQIVPEGAGAFWNEVLDDDGRIVKSSLLQGTVRVIDLGSRTTNYLTIINGKYLDRDSGTLGYGCFELERRDNTPEMFARRIIADLSQRWPSISQKDVMFISGGGALLMEKSLKQVFDNVIVSKEPVTANAKGFRKLGVAYAKKG